MTILKQLQGKNQLPNEIQFATDDIHTKIDQYSSMVRLALQKNTADGFVSIAAKDHTNNSNIIITF